MAFDNVRLPEDIERGATGGPRFQTSIISLGTGAEQRNVDWVRQRCEFEISYGTQYREDGLDDVIKFFYARQGKARSFRFKDWSDFTGVNETLGVGDGAKTQFQLVRNYTSGSVNFRRIITKPVTGTVVVRVDGTLASATVNYSTGIVTLLSAPETDKVVSADFEFDVPVRFDSDKLDVSMSTARAGSVGSITLLEVFNE
jgi:uncharacterized protein (TIGR02217 family)